MKEVGIADLYDCFLGTNDIVMRNGLHDLMEHEWLILQINFALENLNYLYRIDKGVLSLVTEWKRGIWFNISAFALRFHHAPYVDSN